jgi:hypothetical protein
MKYHQPNNGIILVNHGALILIHSHGPSSPPNRSCQGINETTNRAIDNPNIANNAFLLFVNSIALSKSTSDLALSRFFLFSAFDKNDLSGFFLIFHA